MPLLRALLLLGCSMGATATVHGDDDGNRTARQALHNRVAADHIAFHDLKEGRRLIADESSEPYLSQATDDMLRFSIGLEADAPIPQEAAARDTFARQEYARKIREFSDKEAILLRRLIARLDDLTGNAWPLLSRMPWHFVKVDSSFCNAMAHTRGIAIILPEESLGRIAGNPQYGMKLLLHEKLHVVQRFHASRFVSLYADYGFRKVSLTDSQLQQFPVVQNPDAFHSHWGIELADRVAMIIPVLVPGDDNTFDIHTLCRTLQDQPDGSFTVGLPIKEDDEFQEWRESFSSNIELDHPNEVSAYLIGTLFERDFLQIDKPALNTAFARRIEQTRRAFHKALRVDGE